MVFRRCRRLLGEDEAAREATHDVFVKLLKSADRLEASAPSSLLWQAATNLCLNRIRDAKARPAVEGGDLLERIACAALSGGLAEARLTLASIFGKEQASTETIAVLHLVDRMTLEEVAETVGMSVSGVRKRLRTLKAHVAELESVE